MSETEAVNEAIAMSLSEFQDIDESERVNDDELLQTPTDAAMQNAVIAHVGKVLTGDPRMIVVSRLRIWETAKASFKRKSFMSKTGPLKVTFATGLEEEDAIDHGGPRREFLHLLLGAICNDSSTLTKYVHIFFIHLCNKTDAIVLYMLFYKKWLYTVTSQNYKSLKCHFNENSVVFFFIFQKYIQEFNNKTQVPLITMHIIYPRQLK